MRTSRAGPGLTNPGVAEFGIFAGQRVPKRSTAFGRCGGEGSCLCLAQWRGEITDREISDSGVLQYLQQLDLARIECAALNRMEQEHVSKDRWHTS